MSCTVFTVRNEGSTITVALTDDDGVGNAIPTRQSFLDLDVRHEYVTGDMGKTPIRLIHEFILSMDYVTQNVREKLLQLKYNRDRVTLAATGLQDTVSQNLYDTTKGRLYEIISVPSIPLIMDGFTRWMGDVVFRQVNYNGSSSPAPAWFAVEP